MENETKRAQAELEALGVLRVRERSGGKPSGLYLAPACFPMKKREAARTVARLYGWTERAIATPAGSAWLFTPAAS